MDMNQLQLRRMDIHVRGPVQNTSPENKFAVARLMFDGEDRLVVSRT